MKNFIFDSSLTWLSSTSLAGDQHCTGCEGNEDTDLSKATSGLALGVSQNSKNWDMDNKEARQRPQKLSMVELISGHPVPTSLMKKAV